MSQETIRKVAEQNGWRVVERDNCYLDLQKGMDIVRISFGGSRRVVRKVYVNHFPDRKRLFGGVPAIIRHLKGAQ